MEIRYGKRPFADMEKQYGTPKQEGEIDRPVNNYARMNMQVGKPSGAEMTELPQRQKFTESQYKSTDPPPRTNEVDPNTGLTVGFNERIKAILADGNRKAEEALHPYGKNPTVNDIRAGWEREAQAKRDPNTDYSWQKQNPFAEGMGYELAKDEDLKNMGYTDDHIADWKSGRSFHPQEIEYLRSKGVLKAPYAEYLARQEEMRRQAELEAQRQREAQMAHYYYDEPSYSSGGGYSEPSSPAPSQAPQSTPSTSSSNSSQGSGATSNSSYDPESEYYSNLASMAINHFGGTQPRQRKPFDISSVQPIEIQSHWID